MVAQSRIGDQVGIKLLRRDKMLATVVNIVELPADGSDMTAGVISSKQEPNENALSGMAATDITRAVIKQLGMGNDEKGVILVKIEPDSPAEEAGLKKGDIVQEIDRQKIENLNEFNRAVAKVRPIDTVLLFVNRCGKRFYVALSPQ